MKIFGMLPWGSMAERAARALIAWEPPKSGLPKLAEECSELAAAVHQYVCGKVDRYVVASEMADVQLMLVQAVLIIGEDPFAAAIEQKFARLEQRLRDYCAGCEFCGGDGAQPDGERCRQCFFEGAHDQGCPVLSGVPLCNCRRGLRRRLIELQRDIADAASARREPTDEFLEELFRDFREGMPVKEWRRRLYHRVVGHYLEMRDRFSA